MIRLQKLTTYISVTLFSLTSSILQANEPLLLMTEEFAPYQHYSDSDKEISGLSIEIVKAIQKKLSSTDPIKVYPWNRGLKQVNKKKNSAIFSMARTTDRENKYQWVGPLANLEILFFKRKGSEITLNSIDDAKQIKKIGVTKDVATHEILKGMGFENLMVQQSGKDEKNLHRLVKGRIDLFPTALYSGLYSAKKMGLIDKIEPILNAKILNLKLYIAFNKQTDIKIINQWQSALDELRNDGTIDAITSKYNL